MFRNRNDELADLIKLHRILTKDSNSILENPALIQEHISTVTKFLETEIETFATYIIESMFEWKLVDSPFMFQVYEFDHNLFERIFKNIIYDFYPKIGFIATVNIIGSVKTFLQAIMGYEAVYNKISDGLNNKKEAYDLAQCLQNMRAQKMYPQLPAEQKARVNRMMKVLPLYPDKFPDTSELIITNLEKEGYLNFLMTEGSNDENVPLLVFGPLPNSWMVYHDKVNEIFELETNNLVLNLVLQQDGEICKISLVKRNEATNSKWKIQLIEENDPSKGYLIKSAERDIYLGGSEDQNAFFSINGLKEIELNEKNRTAWKFLCADLS